MTACDNVQKSKLIVRILLANSSRWGELTKNDANSVKIVDRMLFSLPNRMACGAKIVKNRIRQQYQSVFFTSM
jgi:hypothetical protein